MNALILAVAALLFSRLVASDRIEPYRLQVVSTIEKATDALPNTLRLPIIVGGAVTLGAIIAYMPLIGAIVTFSALVLILEYGQVTEDSKAILTELRSGAFSQAQVKLTEFSGTDASWFGWRCCCGRRRGWRPPRISLHFGSSVPHTHSLCTFVSLT